MATSLAAQLKRLAVPQTSILTRDKKRPSLLFEPSEAAGFGRDLIYDIGVEGFEELKDVHPDFSKFESFLFSEASKDFERSIQDEKANNKLNKVIKRFFAELSPYFMLNASYKALEWLIYQFSIHEYNKDDLLLLILPYHETKIFVKALQLIRIQDVSDRWFWLLPLQKPGLSLPRKTLLTHAATDNSFIKFISDFVLFATKEHNDPNKLEVLYNFYCIVVTGALQNVKAVTDIQVSQIVPCLMKALSSEVTTFRAASYVITAKLLERTHLSDDLLHKIINKIMETNFEELRVEAVTLLVLIYQTQKQFTDISEEAFRDFSKKVDFVESLVYLNKIGCDVWPLLETVFEKGFDLILNGNKPTEFLNYILDSTKLNEKNVSRLITLLLLSFDYKKSYPDNTLRWLTNFLKTIERQYPDYFDSELLKLFHKAKTTTKEQKSLDKLLELSIIESSYLGLLQALYHPNPSFSKKAVKEVIRRFEALTATQKEKVESFFLSKLQDENIELTLELLQKASSRLKEMLSRASLNGALVKILNKGLKERDVWWRAAKPSLEIFCWDNDIVEKEVFFFTVLPFIFPANNSEMEVFRLVCTSTYVQNLDCFAPFKPLSDKMTFEEVKKKLQKILSPSTNENYVKLLQDYENKFKRENLTCTQKYLLLVLYSNKIPKNCDFETISHILNFVQYCSETSKFYNKNARDLLESVELTRNDKFPVKDFMNCLLLLSSRMMKVNERKGLIDFTKTSSEANCLINFLGIIFKEVVSKDTKKSCLKNICPTNQDTAELLLNYGNTDSINITDEAKLNALSYVSNIVCEESGSLSVPCVLANLYSDSNDVRKLCMNMLKKLKTCEDKYYAKFVSKLLEHQTEICIDKEQLPLVFFNILSLEDEVLKSFVKFASGDEYPICLNVKMSQLLLYLNDLEMFNSTARLALKLLEKANSSWIEANTIIITSNVIRFNNSLAKNLSLDTFAWKFIEKCLRTEKIPSSNVSPTLLLLNQINKDNYDPLQQNVKSRLLELLITLTTFTENPRINTSVSKIIKHIDLDVTLILPQLRKMRDLQSSKQTAKRRRSVIPSADILDLPEWKEGVTVLEFLQDKKKLKNPHLLIPVLFELLKKCLDFDEQASVEYPKQLLLTCIYHCCVKFSISNESCLDVELVVQCIRASQNPQTHHHALVLLTHLAVVVPTQVLHHVMAIFTFMGSSVLRHDDAYSFQIIEKIVDTIVPLLVEKRPGVEVAKVLRVFVDALLDVPEHRRVVLYKHLLEKIGVEENLGVFLLLVFEAHVLHGGFPKEKKSDIAPKRLDVAADLCRQFPPTVVINACIQLIQHLHNLPETPEKSIQTFEDQGTFNYTQHTPKQFRHYKYTIVLFVSSLLSSKQFVCQVAEVPENKLAALEALYKDLIVKVLTFIQTTVKVAERNANTPQAQFWKAILHCGYEILDGVNALLTPQMFLLVLKGLLSHELTAIRRRILELLIAKWQNDPGFFYSCEETNLLELIGPIVNIVNMLEEEGLSQDQEILIQTALLAIKLLVKNLGENNAETFVPILKFVTDLLKSQKASENVQASLILCLAELCWHLRGHAIPAFQRFMPIIIKQLKKRRKEEEEPSLLLVCTVTAVLKVLDSLALFMSPYLEKLLVELSFLMAKWSEKSDDQRVVPLATKFASIKQKIGSTIPSRVLIPAVERAYEVLIQNEWYTSVEALMSILIEGISNLKANEMQANIPELITFFLNALQFRCNCNNDVPESVISCVETSLIKALCTFVLKLSENSFRPLFYRLYDWAVRSSEQPEKVLTFYNISKNIAERLKSLFVLFAGHFLNNAASLLNSCNSTKNETLYFQEPSKNAQLIEHILNTLYYVFLYDSRTFLNRDRFEVLLMPLVDQLENILGEDVDELTQRAKNTLIPCIVQFAVAAGNDALWKQLVYVVLLKMRHQDPKIRLLALECVMGIVRKLDQDYLPLLPETIPFLAELLEDEDETVESECRRSVQEMEKVLGESLQKYF